MPAISARTRLTCLLGHPVSHSGSPAMHNAAFAATGVDAAYLAFDVDPAHLAAALEGLRAVGFLGANVTVPHKLAALALADDATPEARAVGAANTLFWHAGRLVADNTDAVALEQVLADEVGLRRGDGALLLGAGGAARAAAVALGRAGAEVHVAARRPEAAGEVAALAADHGAATAASGGLDAVAPAHRLLVNATPLGWHGETLPDHLTRLTPEHVVLDLVYGVDTPLLTRARAVGARAHDGLGMLVAQAAASFERWTGCAPPVDVMAAAVRGRP